MIGKRLAYKYTYTVPDGSHVINTLANTMEDFGLNWWPNNDPDARSMNETVEVTFTVPASGAVYVLMQSDVHTGTTSQTGYWALREGAATVTGSRQRMTIGGVNRKRHYTYFQLITGLTPGAVKTWKWGIESNTAGGTGVGILHNSTEPAPHIMEVWEASSVATLGAAPTVTAVVPTGATVFTTTDGTTAATSSWTPAAGVRTYIAWVLSAGAVDETPTLAGNGLTWTQVSTQGYASSATPSRRLTCFRARGTATAGATTATSILTRTGWGIAVVECNGVDGATNQGVVQAVAAVTDAAATSFSATLPGFAPGNATLVAFALDNNTAVTPEGGATPLTELVDSGFATPACRLQVQFRGDADNPDSTPSATAASSLWAAIALELKVLAQPARVTGLAATPFSTTRIDLTWTDLTGETGYRIERGDTAGGPWASVGTNAADDVTFSDTGLNPATTYYYRVIGTNDSGDGQTSDTASAATPPESGGGGVGATKVFGAGIFMRSGGG